MSKSRTPKYRRQKSRNPDIPHRAFVELGGRRVYLGTYDTDESRQPYHRAVQEWLTNGRMMQAPKDQITVAELVAAYWSHAQTYYVKGGEPTTGLNNVKLVLRVLKSLYGDIPASKFGPLCLRAVRQKYISKGLSRKTISMYISALNQVFKWGASIELIPASVHQALRTAPPLQRGRSEARETEPIAPVADHLVEQTLAHLSPTLQAMVRVQRLCGMRPGEICSMPTGDIDTNGAVWVYKVEGHKTEHKGRTRLVFVGPKAQVILMQHLKTDLAEYLFSPKQSWLEYHMARRTLANKDKTHWVNPARKTRRKLGNRYKAAHYRQAIVRGCKKAGIAEWSPNQLRHTFATKIRKEHGLEAAQILLGHASADVTQIYAERDISKAVAVAAKIG